MPVQQLSTVIQQAARRHAVVIQAASSLQKEQADGNQRAHLFQDLITLGCMDTQRPSAITRSSHPPSTPLPHLHTTLFHAFAAPSSPPSPHPLPHLYPTSPAHSLHPAAPQLLEHAPLLNVRVHQCVCVAWLHAAVPVPACRAVHNHVPSKLVAAHMGAAHDSDLHDGGGRGAAHDLGG
eukprot:364637-Chlamydomonas_euryale.AAC.20